MKKALGFVLGMVMVCQCACGMNSSNRKDYGSINQSEEVVISIGLTDKELKANYNALVSLFSDKKKKKEKLDIFALEEIEHSSSEPYCLMVPIKSSKFFSLETFVYKLISFLKNDLRNFFQKKDGCRVSFKEKNNEHSVSSVKEIDDLVAFYEKHFEKKIKCKERCEQICFVGIVICFGMICIFTVLYGIVFCVQLPCHSSVTKERVEGYCQILCRIFANYADFCKNSTTN